MTSCVNIRECICNGENTFICSTCSKVFVYKEDLEHHMGSECHVRSGTSADSLSMHVLRCPSNMIKHSCSFCKKKFCSMFTLKKHIQVQHPLDATKKPVVGEKRKNDSENDERPNKKPGDVSQSTFQDSSPPISSRVSSESVKSSIEKSSLAEPLSQKQNTKENCSEIPLTSSLTEKARVTKLEISQKDYQTLCHSKNLFIIPECLNSLSILKRKPQVLTVELTNPFGNVSSKSIVSGCDLSKQLTVNSETEPDIPNLVQKNSSCNGQNLMSKETSDVMSKSHKSSRSPFHDKGNFISKSTLSSSDPETSLNGSIRKKRGSIRKKRDSNDKFSKTTAQNIEVELDVHKLLQKRDTDECQNSMPKETLDLMSESHKNSISLVNGKDNFAPNSIESPAELSMSCNSLSKDKNHSEFEFSHIPEFPVVRDTVKCQNSMPKETLQLMSESHKNCTRLVNGKDNFASNSIESPAERSMSCNSLSKDKNHSEFELSQTPEFPVVNCISLAEKVSLKLGSFQKSVIPAFPNNGCFRVENLRETTPDNAIKTEREDNLLNPLTGFEILCSQYAPDTKLPIEFEDIEEQNSNLLTPYQRSKTSTCTSNLPNALETKEIQLEKMSSPDSKQVFSIVDYIERGEHENCSQQSLLNGDTKLRFMNVNPSDALKKDATSSMRFLQTFSSAFHVGFEQLSMKEDGSLFLNWSVNSSSS